MYLVRFGERGRLIAQELVAGDHGVRVLHHEAKLRETLRAVVATRIIRASQEDRIVEIVDEEAHLAAQHAELPCGKELALHDQKRVRLHVLEEG